MLTCAEKSLNGKAESFGIGRCASAAGEIRFLSAAQIGFVKHAVTSHIRAKNNGNSRRHCLKRGAG